MICLTELRPRAKHLEVMSKVGFANDAPFNDLFDPIKTEELKTTIEQVFSNPLLRTCQRITWYFHYPFEDNKGRNDNRLSRSSLLHDFEDNEANYDDHKSVKERAVAIIQKNFLDFLFEFIQNGKVSSLKKALLNLHMMYSNKGTWELLVSKLSEELKKDSSDLEKVIEEAFQKVASSILTYVTKKAVEKFEEGKDEEGEKFLEVVLKAPVSNDWKSLSLSPIESFVEQTAKKVKETLNSYRGWKPNYRNPHERDCELLFRFARLLKENSVLAYDWEETAQKWLDHFALSMGNYAVEQVNKLLENLRGSLIIGNQQDLLDKIIENTKTAIAILREALQIKTSPSVREYLMKNLELANKLLMQAEAKKERSKKAKKKVSPLLVLLLLFLSPFLFSSLFFSDSSSNKEVSTQTSNSSNQIPSEQHANLSPVPTPDLNDPKEIIKLADKFYIEKNFKDAMLKYKEAIQTLAKNKEEIDPELYYKYAYSLEKIGQKNKAVKAYQAYMKDAPDGEYEDEALEALIRLDGLKRPQTGWNPLYLYSDIEAGNSEITVENETDLDAFIKVYKTEAWSEEELVANVYIRSGDQYTFANLNKGTYFLKIALGLDWNNSTKKFSYRKSFWKSDKVVLREEVLDLVFSRQIRYSSVTIRISKSYTNKWNALMPSSFREIEEDDFEDDF